jgi:hypothetical protein
MEYVHGRHARVDLTHIRDDREVGPMARKHALTVTI